MICDGAPEQVLGEAVRLCQLADGTVKHLKCGTLWSNRAEGHVGIVNIEILLDLK